MPTLSNLIFKVLVLYFSIYIRRLLSSIYNETNLHYQEMLRRIDNYIKNDNGLQMEVYIRIAV